MDLGRRQSWFYPRGASANSCPSAQTQTCCFSRGEKKDKNKTKSCQTKICWDFEEYDYAAVHLCTSALARRRIASGPHARPEGEKSSQEQMRKNAEAWWFQFVERHHHPALSLVHSFSALHSETVRTSGVFMLDWSCVQYMSSSPAPCRSKQWKTISVVHIKKKKLCNYYSLKHWVGS